MRYLAIEPLTTPAFAPFGELIEASDERPHFTINDGFAERYHDLARIDVGGEAGSDDGGSRGRVLASIFRAKARSLPLQLALLERHPLGTQAFMPLSPYPYLVVVAPPGKAPDTTHLRCFVARPGQGVNYAMGTWHHPLIALHEGSDFLVLDRGGPAGESNCDIWPLAEHGIAVPLFSYGN
jgi:ureidoglycolate lyase